MVFEYLDVVGNEIPVKKIFRVGDVSYTFYIRDNDKIEGENLTCEVYSPAGECVYSNKLVYGFNFLFIPIFYPEKVIALNIDAEVSGAGSDIVTKESLGNTILLYTRAT